MEKVLTPCPLIFKVPVGCFHLYFPKFEEKNTPISLCQEIRTVSGRGQIGGLLSAQGFTKESKECPVLT